MNSTGAEAGTALYDTVREILDERLKDVPYWKLVANVAASRGYAYGVTYGAALAGATHLRVSAIIDERTSDICRYLNKKLIPIDDALDQAGDIARADPEGIKTVAPWLAADEIVGKDMEALVGKGVILPPYHSARIRAVYAENGPSWDRGSL